MNDLFNNIFWEAIKTNRNFLSAFDFIKDNTEGAGIWLTGGAVYKTIANKLGYCVNKPFDFDFIAEFPKPESRIILPSGWYITRTSLGSPRIIMPNQKQIDFIDINDIIDYRDKYRLDYMTCDDKLASYLRRVMLNVQSIYYDFDKQTLVGDIGIGAMRNKILEVNNLEEYLGRCIKKGLLINEYISGLAGVLDFQWELPMATEILACWRMVIEKRSLKSD